MSAALVAWRTASAKSFDHASSLARFPILEKPAPCFFSSSRRELAKNSELIQYATEIKVRAERRRG